MGKPGSGKTSMRGVVFSQTNPFHTARFGPTRGIQHNPTRLLNDIVINVLDFGNNNASPETEEAYYIQCSALVYLFDSKSLEESDFEHFATTVIKVWQHTPQCRVFALLNKMDNSSRESELVINLRERALAGLKVELHDLVEFFPTSIFDQSLLFAWSRIIQHLLVGATVLRRELNVLQHLLGAKQVTLIQKQTCLVIASTRDDLASFPHRLKTFSSQTAQLPKMISFNAAAATCFLLDFSPHTFILILVQQSTLTRQLQPTVRAFCTAKQLDKML